MPKSKKPIFRPEIVLDARLTATHQSTKVVIKTMNDAVTVLEGIREGVAASLSDHFVIIYLDKFNVLVGVDTFLTKNSYVDRAGDTTVAAEKYRRQNKACTAVLAQTFAEVDKPTARQVKMQELSDIALRLAMQRIDVIDIIFVGREQHFSFSKDSKAMKNLKDLLQKKKDVLGY